MQILILIFTIVFTLVDASANIGFYWNNSSSTSTAALITENKCDYYGEDLVYRNDTLEMVLTDNGYVDASGNYHYYVLDYQGNVRQW